MKDALLLVLFVMFSSALLAQSYSISGTVEDYKGNPLQNATVLVKDLNIKATTDKNGNFEIKDLPKGVHTLKVSSKGRRTLEKVVYVKSEQFVINLSLKEDLLGLHQLIETGNIKTQPKISSSFSVTSINVDEIAFNTSQSTVSVLSNIPGFTAEATAGELGNNLFSRGMSSGTIFSPDRDFDDNSSKSASAFEFVQLQEDGLPVFEDGALQYAGSDVFSRIDLTSDRIEAMRGGNSAVAASGSPGGVVNVISKTGQNEFKGVAKAATSDYGLFRFDTNFGGALIKDKLFYNIGGFYRTDQGIRVTNFNANNGGQIKANLNYKFEKGEAKVFLKYLSDRNTFFHSIPLQISNGDIVALRGFNANYGTLNSDNYGTITIPQLGTGTFSADLSDGVNPISFSAGASFKMEPIDKLNVENSFRFSSNQLVFNGILARNPEKELFASSNYNSYDDNFTGVASQSAYATYRDIGNPINASYRYVSNGQSINSAIGLVEVDYRYMDRDMSNFANKLKIDFQIDRYSLLSGGYYFSTWETNQLTDVSSLLITASDSPQLVNLVDASNSESHTLNGVSSISYEKTNSESSNNIHALFGNFQSELTDHIKLDLGIRFDTHKYSGKGEDGSRQSLGLINNTSDDDTKVLSGNFVDWEYDLAQMSYAAGASYIFNKDRIAYLNFSRGFRAPTEETIFYEAVSRGGFGSRGLAGLRPVSIIQLEGGYKHSFKNLAVAANLFYLNMADIYYRPGIYSTRTRDYGNISNIGLELEAAYQIGKFKARFNGTIQNPRYRNFNFSDTGGSGNPEGNTVRRIPLYHFGVTPSYQINKNFNAFTTWNRTGKAYNDQSNRLELPGYSEIDLGGTYRIQRFLIGLQITNLLNSIGVREVTGLEVGEQPNNGSGILGRPILGRTVRLALTYDIDKEIFNPKKKASF